jgi:hypothetical protein
MNRRFSHPGILLAETTQNSLWVISEGHGHTTVYCGFCSSTVNSGFSIVRRFKRCSPNLVRSVDAEKACSPSDTSSRTDNVVNAVSGSLALKFIPRISIPLNERRNASVTLYRGMNWKCCSQRSSQGQNAHMRGICVYSKPTEDREHPSGHTGSWSITDVPAL